MMPDLMKRERSGTIWNGVRSHGKGKRNDIIEAE
jgi:hypothetical protein